MEPVSYTLLFDPEGSADRVIPDLPLTGGDRSAQPVYVYTPPVTLAVNVALATGRPLLLRGEPGSGKSSLARHVAWKLGWRYYEEVITSRTRAQDLQWHFDALRRLQDAQVKGQDLSAIRYIKPGVLWWALDREKALYRGVKKDDLLAGLEVLDDPAHPVAHARAAVLLDEIDKADPDVPNNLLDVLGSRHFKVDETGAEITGDQAPLIFITTNGERELPEAFLRRCVVLKLEAHKENMLKKIARTHFPEADYQEVTDALISAVYKRLKTLADDAQSMNLRGPSTAEFLDTLRACNTLGIGVDDEDWKAITRATLWKAKDLPKIDTPTGVEPLL